LKFGQTLTFFKVVSPNLSHESKKGSFFGYDSSKEMKRLAERLAELLAFFLLPCVRLI